MVPKEGTRATFHPPFCVLDHLQIPRRFLQALAEICQSAAAAASSPKPFWSSACNWHEKAAAFRTTVNRNLSTTLATCSDAVRGAEQLTTSSNFYHGPLPCWVCLGDSKCGYRSYKPRALNKDTMATNGLPSQASTGGSQWKPARNRPSRTPEVRLEVEHPKANDGDARKDLFRRGADPS